MKKILLLIFILCLSSITWGLFSNKKQKKMDNSAEVLYDSYIKEATSYCQKKKLCTDFFILIDYSIHSGKERLFIYNFNTEKFVNSYLVSHGCGTSPTAEDFSREKPVFSNEPNSHCSSLGKYLLSKQKVKSTNFGEKYLLYGQDSTNNNALRRDIVLHPWSIIPDKAPYPKGIPESWGCPAVSLSVFQLLDKQIQTTDKNVLLWAIYLK